ncbi:MAG TPA: rhomboid family intramembrane serine protease [Candidatus Limnocylindria bacterium]|nr:rhomboid family intramembrane serine protease [Candidatus Limnocylindria bacterium]
MIPLKDMSPRRSLPLVTILLIVANVLVFFYQIGLSPRAADAFINTYGLVPVRIQFALAGSPRVTLGAALVPLFTCMFLHGGWLHILGNMWFLWIFGGNVEDRLGSLTYLVFYLVCGIASGVTQTIFSWGSHIPSVGASGAISGILGAYIVFFPYARILTLVPLFIFFFTARIPAAIFIGLWFVVQFLSGVGSLGAAGTAATGGVAWWAHIGGFVLGAILAGMVKGRPADNWSSA